MTKLAIKTRRLLTPLQELRDAVILIDGERIEAVDQRKNIREPRCEICLAALGHFLDPGGRSGKPGAQGCRHRGRVPGRGHFASHPAHPGTRKRALFERFLEQGHHDRDAAARSCLRYCQTAGGAFRCGLAGFFVRVIEITTVMANHPDSGNLPLRLPCASLMKIACVCYFSTW